MLKQNAEEWTNSEAHSLFSQYVIVGLKREFWLVH